MRKILSLFAIVTILPLLVSTGCRQYVDEPIAPAQNEFETLVNYMDANGLDFATMSAGWVKAATLTTAATPGIVDPTDFSIPGYYVIDVRSADAFGQGHIKNAHNVVVNDILTEAPKAGSDPILVVCYTGQTAARATGLLRMAGFTAYSLKWGMSSWNTAFRGSWNGGAKQLNSPGWVTSGTPTVAVEHDLPTLNTGKTTGAEILQARIQAVLAMPSSEWLIDNSDVLANSSNYFINNKWGEAHWTAFGHIQGAYRMDTDNTLGLDGLKYFDPNASTVVNYCYTGQTSSILTSWLQVLGYENARSLKYGASGIIWDELKSGAKADATSKKSTWMGEGSASENDFGFVTN